MLHLGLLGLCSLASADEDTLPATAPDLTWYLIPNAAFDTDDGLGFGFRGELQRKDGQRAPYRDAWVVQGFSTLRGYHNYLLRYDRVGIGDSQRHRFTLNAAFRTWGNDQYYGMGAVLPLDATYLQDFEADDPRRKYYRYRLVQPQARALWLTELAGPWEIWASTSLLWSQVDTYEGSLLEAEQPYGMDGGWAWQVQAGAQLDLRDREIDTRSGSLVEVYGRYNPPIPGSAGVYGGVGTSIRGWLPLGDRTVLAGRLMTEVLAGEVPFYALIQWGGAVPTVGYGGYQSLRGLSYGRFRAPGKALLNAELRWDALTHQLAGKPFRWELVPFVDVGTVFLDEGSSGPALHPAVGVGLRPIFDEAFVGRMDLGFARDQVLRDGELQVLWTPGFYLTYEHLF